LIDNLFNLIAFAVLVVIISLLLIDDMRIRSKRKLLASELIQQTLDKMALLQHVEKLSAEAQSKDIEQTDGFLKFVSDSRDWAFQYIETVQEALEAFDKRVTPTLEYYSTYGTAVEGLHTGLTKELAEAYADLKKVLPQDKI
jgi:hypothetical protein